MTFTGHVARAIEEINGRYSTLGKGGTYNGHGEDPPGMWYAVDFWTTSRAVHDEVFKWLIENGKRLGIWYIISWKRIYSFKHPERGIQVYTRYGNSTDPYEQHYNHIHVSFFATPPQDFETTGVPLMATATAVKVSYKGDQLLNDTEPHIFINAATDKTIVKDSSEGIDLTATIEVDGLKEGEFVDVWWSREWKKSGATDQIKGGDIPITIRANDAVQVRYADKLSKADTGWIACLRLRYATNSKTAKVVALQVRGWKL